jgi:hypothetical protein
VFHEGVQHLQRFCIDHLSYVKTEALGANSHVVFGKKYPGVKESVIWCVVVMQRPALLTPTFRGKVFTTCSCNRCKTSQ